MPLPLPTSQEEIDRIQSERKVVAVERALRAPFHKKRLDGIDLKNLDDPEEWAKIPILDKEELRSIPPGDFMDLFCIAPRHEIAELWRSGGSTGVPLFYPRTFEDMKYGVLSFARTFKCGGAGAGDTAHVSFPLGIHPVGHVYARAAQAEGIGVNWAGSGSSTPSALQIDLLDRLKPTIWMGMSSYGIHLANLAEARGIDLAANPVKLIMCSAEAISEAKRTKIERMWGARLHDNFGMTEAGMMGSELGTSDGFRIWSDMFFVEVVDQSSGKPVPEGEEGLLVVTPLWTNNATPFLRWNSGDIVTYRSKGRGTGPFSIFPVVGHAHRTAGFFKVRGVNINHSEFEDFMFGFEQIVDFKAEILTENDLDTLRVSVELIRAADWREIAERIGEATKNTFEVRPDVALLERGTLAAEFEGSVKAPRFVDRRD